MIKTTTALGIHMNFSHELLKPLFHFTSQHVYCDVNVYTPKIANQIDIKEQISKGIILGRPIDFFYIMRTLSFVNISLYMYIG